MLKFMLMINAYLLKNSTSKHFTKKKDSALNLLINNQLCNKLQYSISFTSNNFLEICTRKDYEYILNVSINRHKRKMIIF